MAVAGCQRPALVAGIGIPPWNHGDRLTNWSVHDRTQPPDERHARDHASDAAAPA
jgi:hypothetical protein